MINKSKHIAPKIRKYLTIFLSLQFFVAYTLSYFHLIDKECCHSKKSEDSCCMVDNMKSFHCSMEDIEIGISHCGCNHSTDDAIDQFLTSEKPGYSHYISFDSTEFDLITEKGSCSNLSYQLKFLPDSVPKYISNSSFLI